MKKLALTLSLLLALTACGKAPAAETPGPAPQPVQTSAPVAAPSPEPISGTITEAWCAGLDLTALPTRESGPAELEDGTKIVCLGQAKEADIALYTVWFPTRNFPELLIRYVDKLQGLGTTDISAQVKDLVYADFDEDGQEELCAVLRWASTTSLTLYEWDEGWTARPYDPSDFSGELLDLLSVKESASKVTVSYGRDTAGYTPGPNDKGLDGLHRAFGDMAVFRVEDGQIYAVFGLAADVGGELRYFATLTAWVVYDGTGFSLYDLKLLSNSGV